MQVGRDRHARRCSGRPWPPPSGLFLALKVKTGVKSRPFRIPTGRKTMVVIRLARGGAKKRPFFNLVVADSRRARDGRFIERIGFYNPKAPQGQETLRIDRERLAYWRSKGALLSDTAARLVKQLGEQKAA
jgi:small subunit ribosomal protein S16